MGSKQSDEDALFSQCHRHKRVLDCDAGPPGRLHVAPVLGERDIRYQRCQRWQPFYYCKSARSLRDLFKMNFGDPSPAVHSQLHRHTKLKS